MKYPVLLTACMGLSTLAFADGRITGTITDAKTAEPLTGVVVAVKGGTAGTSTDVDGHFSLSLPSGKYTLEIRYLGYDTKSLTAVEVADEQTLTLNHTLTETQQRREIGEVVVRGTLKKEAINAMILVQKNAATVAQVVSAEAIRRSPDRNTGEVLKRVSGASLQDGKYLVVRGLADRYNAAMLNGALLTSTEPDRKTFSFDLFPAAIIDNIVINKAAVPELPGEFAGGLVQVNTRDIPTEDFLTAQIGTGSNTQTLGKTFAKNNLGSTDWLGLDDGARRMAPDFPGSKNDYEGKGLPDRIVYSRMFKNNFAIAENTAPLNVGGQLTGGLSRRLWGGKLGFTGSLNYNKTARITESERFDYNDDGSQNYAYQDKRSTQNVLWGALANLAYAKGNNKISWKNLVSVNSNNQVTQREGTDQNGPYDIRAYELAFVSNRFFSSQLGGEHTLENSGLKIRWNGSYTNVFQNTPDLRRVNYQRISGSGDPFEASIPQGSASLTSSGRFYSRLADHVFGGSLDLSKTFQIGGATHTLKGGYLVQRKTRDFSPRAIGYVSDRTNPDIHAILQQDISSIFSEENIAANRLYLSEITNPQDKYAASSLQNAGYIQLENPIFRNLQAVWGLRVENYQQSINSTNSLGKELEKTTTTTDFLPSANLKYSLTEKTALRLSGSQTVIRPEFRELAEFSFYNFDLFAVERGNPNIQRTKVTNADLRYEWYPSAGEFVTAGVFYKHFQNPIERFYNSTGAGSQSLEYGNTPSAYSYGAEVEFRKSLGFLNGDASEDGLLANTFLFSNVAYIQNEVQFAKGSALKARPMQGQSNYVINAGVSADYRKTGTNLSVLVNRIGRRIFIVGNGLDQLNIWEAPRTLLDAQITQRLGRNAEVKLSVSDLLSQYARFYEDANDNGKYDASDVLRIQSRYGANVSLGFTYKLPSERRKPVGSVTIP